MKFQWDSDKENYAIAYREQGNTYHEIGKILGTTATSVKHKIRRIQQNDNQNRYRHTEEKSEMFHRHIVRADGIKVLEMHCGFGGMTEVYSQHGSVECYDIDRKRVDFVNEKKLDGVTAARGDSEKELYRLVAEGRTYDVVDIDPYGLPSRYFPHAFALINDGLMFLTFPMMGVAQINKITIRHYQAFWGIELSDNAVYVEKIKAKLVDFAFQHKREVEFLEIAKVERIYRFAMRVRKRSLCDIVGLKVNR